MAHYTYQGEKFQVEDTGDGELTVSDGAGTYWVVARDDSRDVYEVTNEGHRLIYPAGVSPGEAVEKACSLLLRDRQPRNADEARKALSDFVRNL